MKTKTLIIFLIIVIIAVFLLAFYFLHVLPSRQRVSSSSSNVAVAVKSQSIQNKLSPLTIMEVIKTDKDYNDLSSFINGFDPEILSYSKLGPAEYKNIRLAWQKEGFGDRTTAIDKLNLSDSTYWIDLGNKKDKSKELLTLIDVKENKSLFLAASMSISVGVGM